MKKKKIILSAMFKRIMDLFKPVALVLVGVLSGIIINLLIQPLLYNACLNIVLIIIIVCLILYGTGIFSLIWYRLKLWWRKGKMSGVIKVGILSDMGWEQEDNQIHSWTDIRPEEWKKEIEKLSRDSKVIIKVKLINVEEDFDSYVAILNPYGGVYPEYNLKNFETLNKIFNYVNEGGLFVNVADIPGYWAYNPKLRRRLTATPPIYGVERLQDGRMSINALISFVLAPFMKELGLNVIDTKGLRFDSWDIEFENKFNEFNEGVDRLIVYRAVVVEKNVETIIKPKNVTGIGEMTPFCFVNYGEGRFLMLLLVMEEKFSENMKMKEVLVKILIDELVNKKEIIT